MYHVHYYYPITIWLLLLCLCFLPNQLVQADVVCDFKMNRTCGFEWQKNLLPMEWLDSFPTLSSSGMLVLDLTKVNHSIAPGARAYSKYYPTNSMPHACLIIKFLTFGPGIHRFAIIQRQEVDQRVYEYENDWFPGAASNRLDQYWITMTIPIDLMFGPVQFFFEISTDGHSSNGLFALDHIAFVYYRCPFKQMPHYPCLDVTCASTRRI